MSAAVCYGWSRWHTWTPNCGASTLEVLSCSLKVHNIQRSAYRARSKAIISITVETEDSHRNALDTYRVHGSFLRLAWALGKSGGEPPAPTSPPARSGSRQIQSRSVAGYGHRDTYLPTHCLERATGYTEHRVRIMHAEGGRRVGSNRERVCWIARRYTESSNASARATRRYWREIAARSVRFRHDERAVVGGRARARARARGPQQPLR